MENGLVVIPHVTSVGGVEPYTSSDRKQQIGFQFKVSFENSFTSLWYESESEAKEAKKNIVEAIKEYWNRQK